MGDITKIEQEQKIDYDFSQGLSFEPETIPEYYTTPNVQRTISMITAQEAASAEQTPLRATAAGRLLTSSLDSQFTVYNSGFEFRSTPAAFILDFGEPKSVIKLFSFVAPYSVRLDKGDGVFGNDTIVPFGKEYKITYATQRIQFLNYRNIAPNTIQWSWWV